jgi:hypothetical protein
MIRPGCTFPCRRDAVHVFDVVSWTGGMQSVCVRVRADRERERERESARAPIRGADVRVCRLWSIPPTARVPACRYPSGASPPPVRSSSSKSPSSAAAAGPSGLQQPPPSPPPIQMGDVAAAAPEAAGLGVDGSDWRG